ncbi:hypothetical protein F4776DRAFT_666018 [Hypoxylon sp. NC0597]|nr:hypothetical protein F4776DRAFT_666018 [Hypoxylon sp. NC0597]
MPRGRKVVLETFYQPPSLVVPTNLEQIVVNSTNKMSDIKVANNTSVDIYVSVTASGGDYGKGGSESWYTLKANGGSSTWGSRKENQVVSFTRSQNPGATVESVLGVPGKTVPIY